MRKIQDLKNKISLYYNKGTIDYNQWRHSLHLGNKQYKQFPKKKKPLKRERGKEKEMEKRRKRKKREKNKEEKRGKERRKERKKGE